MNIREITLKIMLPAIALLASCDKSYDGVESTSQSDEITISTRATTSEWSGKSISLSDGSTTTTYTNNGTSWSSTSPLVWPTSGILDLSGFLMLSGATESSVTIGTASQAISQVGDLDSYDYIYYAEEAVRPVSGDFEITFDRVMSQVKFTVTTSAIENITSLTISSPASQSANAGVWSPSQSDVVTITPDVSGNAYTAYVIPQSYSADSYVVDIETNLNNYTATYTSAVEFEAGNTYSFTIVIDNDSVKASFTSNVIVSEWSTATLTGVSDATSTTPSTPDPATPLVWSGLASSTSGAFGGGSGTSEEPFLISTPEHLAELASIVNDSSTEGTNYTLKGSSNVAGYWNQHFRQCANFDMNNINWTPIADVSTLGLGVMGFGGTYDGDGYTISNLKVVDTSTSSNGAGLFGQVRSYTQGYPATIKNVTITDSSIVSDGVIVGFFSGYLHNYCTITSCNVTNSSITANNATTVGGIAGQFGNADNLISFCTVDNLTVNSTYSTASIGGILGKGAHSGSIIGCQVDATLNVAGNQIGGIVGAWWPTGNVICVNSLSVYGCYSTGTITTSSSNNIAGIAGHSSGYLIGCYSSMATKYTWNTLCGGGIVKMLYTSNQVDYTSNDIFIANYTTNTQDAIIEHKICANGAMGSATAATTPYLPAELSVGCKVDAITQTEADAMNTAFTDKGLNYEYVASSENAAFPYVLQIKN